MKEQARSPIAVAPVEYGRPERFCMIPRNQRFPAKAIRVHPVADVGQWMAVIVAGPVKWHEARQFAVYDQCRQMNGAARIELLERGQDEPVFAKRIGRGCGRGKTAPRLHELRRYAVFPGSYGKPVGTNGA